ncbi:MAG TPA: TetR/AcrR family transcriptional regulator [Marmoricola sp.]
MTRQRSRVEEATAPEEQAAQAAAAVAERHSGVESAALSASLEQLAVGGVKGLTIEGVAARTGIAKTTLYRRWRSKEDLALAVLLDMARMATSAPAGPDVRAGLVGYLQAVVTILRDTLMGQVMQGLASDLATDPEMARAFREEVVALRQEHLASLIRHGVDDGQLRGDVDLALLQELLFGPVYYRLLFSGQPLEDDLAERIVDAVLPAILAEPRQP